MVGKNGLFPPCMANTRDLSKRRLINVIDKLKFVGHYSYLSATSGSTFVARRAGM
jgi:hypothetical protein